MDAIIARISASRASGTEIDAFAGGNKLHTIFSPMPVQDALLGFFDKETIASFRLTCNDVAKACRKTTFTLPPVMKTPAYSIREHPNLQYRTYNANRARAVAFYAMDSLLAIRTYFNANKLHIWDIRLEKDRGFQTLLKDFYNVYEQAEDVDEITPYVASRHGRRMHYLVSLGLSDLADLVAFD
jgi:hypothetical protein